MCRFECLTASIAVMSGKELPKVADAEKESHYGYVFGVSGPGEDILNTYKKIKNIKNVKRCRDGMPKSMQTR